MSLLGRKMLFPLVLVFTAAAINAATAFSTASAKTIGSNAKSERTRETREQEIREYEIRRIHNHFDSVLVELRAANTSALTRTQLANREKLVQTLVSYNARGEFPHNYDFETPTPYFIDRKTGTLCAVAYLLESTGKRDVVDRVARTNNNVWVAQLNGDTQFESWLKTNGVTLQEAARIQVPYASDAGATQNEVLLYGAAIFVPLGTSIGTSAWNAWGNRNGHSRPGAYVGLVSSAATTGMGLFVRSQQEGARGVRAAAYSITLTGLAGGILATRSLMHRPKYLAARAEADNAKRGRVETNVAPIIPLGKDGGAGLSMSIRF